MIDLRLAAWAALLLTIGPARSGTASRTVVEDALSGIDFLPDRATLGLALSNDVAALVALANSSAPSVTPGIRIRALRSLGLFNSDIARNGLTAAVVEFRDSSTPNQQLYLIAAIEGLGQIAGPSNLATLASTLGHDLPDVRVAAATALATTRLLPVCALLRTQYNVELMPQVRVTLNNLLFELDAVCG
jgi:HEAT repeat protein